MPSNLSYTCLCVAPLVLGSACSDFGFGRVRDTAELDESDPGARPGSPWDGLESGERPDPVLAAAWYDVANADDIWQLGWRCYPHPALVPRFGFLDLQGRILVEISAPVADPRAPTNPFAPSRSGSFQLSTVDSTRFLALSTPSADQPEQRVAWIADGETEVAEALLTWTTAPWAGEPTDADLRVAATGLPVPLPHPVLDLLVAVDPMDDGVAWVAPLYRAASLAPDAPLLFRLPLAAPGAAESWSAADLLDDLGDVDGFYPSSVELLRHAGEVSVVIGLVGAETIDGRLERRGPGRMLRLHPADGRVSWSFDFSYLPTGSSAAAFGDETGLGWLSPSFPSDAGGLGANLDRTQARPAFVDLGPEPDGPLGCPQTAALLDADAPTALFHAVVEGDDGLSGSSLIVAHRGERVWRADGVREGLSRTQVLFDSVVVLPE